MKTQPLTPLPGWRQRLLLNEDLNFLLTNRIPRRLLTQFIGWYSRIRSRWLTRWSIAVWRQFTELDLSDAAKNQFDSLHDCFTRELKPGARPLDSRADRLVSPVDALVGACGRIEAGTVLQAKGMPYTLSELLGCDAEVARFEGGQYLTLRLTSAMYHRFHAPDDARIEHVRYLSGDCWNVNPIALAAHRAPVLPQRAGADLPAPGRRHAAGHRAGCRRAGGQHPLPLSGHRALPAAARGHRAALRRGGAARPGAGLVRAWLYPGRAAASRV
jgi:hypothetical protein